METFAIARPPSSPGLYAIKNNKTGHIYLGSSRNLARRYEQWVYALNGGRLLPRAFEFITQTPGDWSFVVLEEHATLDSARLAEHRALQVIENSPNNSRLLNRQTVVSTLRSVGRPPRVPITDAAGKPLSVSVVASALGIPTTRLYGRLAMLRKQGAQKIAFSEGKLYSY